MIGRSNAVSGGGIEWKELVRQSPNVLRAPPSGDKINFAIDGVPLNSEILIRTTQSDHPTSILAVSAGGATHHLSPNAEAILIMTSEYEWATNTVTGTLSVPKSQIQCEYTIVPND